MFEFIGRYLRLVEWRFTGAAAELVVEELETVGDALGYVASGAIVTSAFLFATHEALHLGPIVGPFVAAGASVLVLMSAWLTATGVLAAWWYATEVTELKAHYWAGGQ